MKQFIIILIIATFAGQSLQAQCYEDRHSTNVHDSWLSCATSDNPNPSKADSHWLLYNLGQPTEIFKSTFWNFNYPAQLENGLQSISIDYSLDSVSWVALPDLILEQAPGSSLYEGIDGPDFNGASMQYILITANSNYGGDCFGLSEIRFATASDEPVAVNEIESSLFEITIQPNPFSNQFTFSSNVKIDLIQIYDTAGKLINSVYQPNSNEAIDISYLQSGNYFLNFKTNQDMQMHRAVKF